MQNCIFRLIAACFFVIASPGLAFSQCASFAAAIPDSACQGVSITVNNTPQSNYTYEWDFCTGELDGTPTGINMGPDPNLFGPQEIKLFKAGNDYHLFVINYSSGFLIRYDFGNSLNNQPTSFNYGNLGLISNPTALDIFTENGNYFAFVVNSLQKKLIRVDLGNSISANIATATDQGTFNFSDPFTIKMIKDGSDYFAFVSNITAPHITRLDFGTSVTNQPAGTDLVNSVFQGGTGFDLKYDCNINKWVGFLGNYGLANCNAIDFGSSLMNTPTVAATFNVFGRPGGLELIPNDGNWYLSIVCYLGNQLQNFKLEGNLLANPTQVFLDTIAQLYYPKYISSISDSLGFVGFITNEGNQTLSKVRWNCINSNVSILNQSADSATVICNSPGYNYFTLTATNPDGITTTLRDSLFINELPDVSFGYSAACLGSPVQFNDSTTVSSGSIANWLWNFNDTTATSSQQNPTHSFNAVNGYYVSLTVTSQSGCTGIDSALVQVSQPPVAGFAFPDSACQHAEVTFNDASVAFGNDQLQSWSWEFGDGSSISALQNTTHIYDSLATFTVVHIVTTDKGCSDTLSSAINIKPSPVAGFTVSQTCAAETAVFLNGTTITPPIGLSYDWSFGDGNTSVLTDPTNDYLGLTGNYTVTLISVAANGCSDTASSEINIASQPVPAFTYSPTVVCVGNPVSFISQSTGTGTDTISQYIWDFGDLSGSFLMDPTHAFADTGVYNVTLTVVSPTSCDSSLTQQVYVIPSPTATFTVQNVCLGVSAQFNPFVTTPPGTQVDSVVWDFGDGTQFNGLTSPAHSYLSPGTYGVSMTVYNNLLCTGSFSDSVTIYPLPAANFNTTLACTDAAVLFDGSISSVMNDTLATWLWNFDGLGTSTDSITQFTFADSGYYDVTLIVSTIHGCTDTISNSVYVIPSPDFDFSFTEACFGIASNFTFIENTNPPPPANLVWDFGDNSQSSLLNPIHLYASPDTFNVSLLVLNPNTGCASQKEKMLVVRPLPSTGFTLTDGCEGTVFSFTDTSSILSGAITSWNWDLGPAGTSSDQFPSVSYEDPGIYTITLTAVSDFNCSNSVSQQLTVHPEPQISFTQDPLFGSPPLTVNFTNNSVGATQFIWSFGDGGASTDPNPTHIFQDTGSYQVNLTGTSTFGCVSDFSQQLSVLVPYLDVSVEKTYFTVNNNIVTVSANIINKGNLTVNELSIKGFLDDGSPIIETWNGELKPGLGLLYTFNAGFLIDPEVIPGYVCVEAVTANGELDEVQSNNLKCDVNKPDFEVFSAFPNPFQEQLTISLNLPFEDEFTIELHDAEGRLVLKKENLEGLKGFNTARFDTRSLARGVYALTLTYRDEIKMIKVIRY